MPREPNVDFGTPTIFFDSHPHEQESYLYSYWSSLKSTLRTAWTGDVPKFHNTGTLRIIWWTHDGNRGLKDFELHEFMIVREKFDVLLALPDVRRVLIMGYSGQNPYLLRPGGRGDKLEREMGRMEAEGKRAREARDRDEGMGADSGGKNGEGSSTGGGLGAGSRYQGMDNTKEGRGNAILDIEDIIERSDRAEEEKRREQEERLWKENDGLLSGEMV
jgi:hypothetical protein